MINPDIPKKKFEWNETRHSMKRRSPWHDYSLKGTYMITLVVDDRLPLLGHIAGDAETAECVLSTLGQAIANEEVKRIHQVYPMVDVWKVCIMPDHIHMILRINDNLPKGKRLGAIIRGFKTGCTRAWWRLQAESEAGTMPPASEGSMTTTSEGTMITTSEGETSETVTAPRTQPTNEGAHSDGAATVFSVSPEKIPPLESQSKAPKKQPALKPSAQCRLLFEQGYNDKILMNDGQLDRWKNYLDDNPRRLLLKRQNPQFFTVLHNIKIGERQCQIIGNRFLLDIPDKVAVIVHRRYTDEENARLRAEWLACGERGGVLVSAAISQKEKAVLREAFNLGYRIILLRENGFPELYKPSGESFDRCAAGLLLQISPWDFHMERKIITRAQCLELNALAERIANE